MSDDPKKPKQELLPPQRRSTEVARPAHPKPTGVIGSVTSGFVARVQSRSIDAHTERHKSTLAYINVDTEIAAALKANFITWGELYDIDNILDEQQRGREVGRLMARIRDASALERLEKEAEIQTEELDQRLIEARARRWELEREIERRQQAAASLETEKRWHNLEGEEHAQRKFLNAQRDRLIAQAVHDSIVQTQVLLAGATEADTRYQYLTSLAALRQISDVAPTIDKAPDKSLAVAIESFENFKDLARQRNDPTEVGIWDIAIAALTNLRKEKS